MKSSENANIIVLDLNGCKTLYDVHETIRKTFSFPDWYGANWDAFNDLLSQPREYTIVEVRGYYSLPKDIAPYCNKLIEILDRNQKYYEGFMQIQDKWDRRFYYSVID